MYDMNHEYICRLCLLPGRHSVCDGKARADALRRVVHALRRPSRITVRNFIYDMNNEYNMSCLSLLPGRHSVCDGKARADALRSVAHALRLISSNTVRNFMYNINNEYNMFCLFLLPGRQGKNKNRCNGKAKSGCTRKDGSCVQKPFEENCEKLYGSEGRLFKRACKSRHCMCCAR